MTSLKTMTYAVDGRIARITLDRPARGNGITLRLPRELAHCVEQANLDPGVHVIALSGNGTGFCGGYDLVESAEGKKSPTPPTPGERTSAAKQGDATAEPVPFVDAPPPTGSPLDPAVQAKNHLPDSTWDPMVDYAMMSRNVRGFMSLFHSEKPVVCKVHGYCVAGGTDMALCSDLLIIADDAKIGYPPARVWGSPTTALWAYRIGIQKAKRLLFTGDCLTGKEAYEWGLAIESAPPDQLDARFEMLIGRIAQMPINQLVMMKLLTNQTLMAQGLFGTQLLGTLLDGMTRHTAEGYAFQQTAMSQGFKEAVRQRDEPFGDFGLEGFKKR